MDEYKEQNPRGAPEPSAPPASQVTDSPPRVIVGGKVFDGIADKCRDNLTREQGGFLLGREETSESGLVVTILAFIPAEGAAERHSQVTFTNETWNRFHKRKAAEYPALAVVGWYHTHPGFGIFLSKEDMFIQNNFFNKPGNLALVVDPTRRKPEEGWGFFGWAGPKSVQMREFEVDHGRGEEGMESIRYNPAPPPRPRPVTSHIDIEADELPPLEARALPQSTRPESGSRRAETAAEPDPLAELGQAGMLMIRGLRDLIWGVILIIFILVRELALGLWELIKIVGKFLYQRISALLQNPDEEEDDDAAASDPDRTTGTDARDKGKRKNRRN